MNGQVDVGSRARTGALSASLRRWPAGSGAAGSDSGRQLSVCLYTPSADPSGMGEHMLDLVAEYVPDLAVSLMCWPTEPGQRVLDRAAALGAATLVLPRPRDPAFARVITGFLRARPADVFHVHVGTGREDFDGARAARAVGVPAIVQTQHQPWLLSGPIKRASFFHGVAEVDRLIAVSQAERRTYERIGVPVERFCTVPNGVGARAAGPGRRAARTALGLEPDQPVVMTVGRLVPMKGHCRLIECTPGLRTRFPRLAVLIVGEGHLHRQLAEQVDALGVGDCVRLLGHRPDARQLLDAADVFVLPSLHEGMPLVAMEAMEAGLPVVATRVIGNEEVVVDGETGLLTPAADAPALGSALAELLSDPALRERQGRAGRQRYVDHFTRRRMAEQTRAVYATVLEAVGAVPAGGTR